jgi:formyl-CoA transferase
VNRNKRSVGLDLRRDEARDVFLSLVATADVVVENFRPGTLDRWGIGYTACRAVRPDVIMLSISGWGQYGPGAQRRGYDPVVQAEGGWMALNGPPDSGPARAPTFLADDLAGLHGALAALAALHHRERTGEGQHVDVAMLDALLFSSDGLLTMAAAGAPPRRWGDETEFVVPSNTYACAHGTVYLVAALDRQWRSLAEAIGRPELARAPGFATNAERCRNRHEVNAVLARWCAGLPAEKVIDALAGTDVVAGRVRDLAEVAADPHVQERDMLQPTRLSNGAEAPLTGPAAKFGRTPTRVRRGAPEPGADTDEVLEALGLDASARETLRRAGAI